MFGDTDNHLMLVDVSPFNITGHEAETVLDEVGITINKNMIPNDPRSPLDPSGIRIGTPALTTRGMEEEEMEEIGNAIVALLQDKDNEELKTEVRKMVARLTEEFPLYSSEA